MGVPAGTRRLRFGLFEADLSSRELYKSGRPVHLQDQPFQLLVMLLQRPGEVVSREDLRRALWPAETFVDFDEGLNTAVKKLRYGLGDAPDNPTFVETVPRRGYRFIAPINGSADISQLPEQPASISDAERSPQAAPLQRRSLAVSRHVVLLSLAIMTLLIFGALVLWIVSTPRLPRVVDYRQLTSDGRPKSAFTADISGIVSDGERVYFQEIEDERFVVSQVYKSGGEVAKVPSPFANTLLFDLSVSRAELLVGNLIKGSEISLWALPIPAGPPRRLGEISGQSATWNQDGTKIFFANKSGLYSANGDGSSPLKLAELRGALSWVRCSPDGRRLRFTESEAETNSHTLWEIATDGTNLHRLLPGWHDPPDECCGTWTPDGKYYVFQTYSHARRKDLWTLLEKAHWPTKSQRPIRLTYGPLDFNSPQPSTDGNTLFTFGLKQRSELLRYDAHSGFVPYLRGLSAAGLAFSSDREWIAYTAVPEGTLWRSKIDGSERLQLTYTPMDVIVPRWSPDGKQIAFSARLPKVRRKSFLISSDGGIPKEIVPGAFFSSDPSWSQDGKSIVLWLADSGFLNKRISIVDLATRSETRLPQTEQLFSPRWSPDGRYIAAISWDEKKLMVFDRLRQKWIEVAQNWIGYPSWSHDGSHIYFDTLGEDSAFYRVRLSDRKVERLVSLKGTRRFWSDWEPWSGLAPDDSLLIQRDTGTQEIYALEWTHN